MEGVRCADLLAHLRRDETAPRVTFYDDTPGPTRGERIELSGKVLANWVAKAGNLLQEEFDAAPGTSIGVDLPPQHWRTLYWALATWSVGATLSDSRDADVLITDDPRQGDGQIVVTLAALARASTAAVPDGAIDEAAQLSSYDDHFDAWAAADDADPAISVADTSVTYADLVPPLTTDARRVWVSASSLTGVLRDTLRVWATGGGVVLIRNPDEQAVEGRLRAEGAGRG